MYSAGGRTDPDAVHVYQTRLTSTTRVVWQLNLDPGRVSDKYGLIYYLGK